MPFSKASGGSDDGGLDVRFLIPDGKVGFGGEGRGTTIIKGCISALSAGEVRSFTELIGGESLFQASTALTTHYIPDVVL